MSGDGFSYFIERTANNTGLKEAGKHIPDRAKHLPKGHTDEQCKAFINQPK